MGLTLTIVVVVATLAIVWELRQIRNEVVEVGTLLADIMEVINNLPTVDK
jgi:hypothetical protein